MDLFLNMIDYIKYILYLSVMKEIAIETLLFAIDMIVSVGSISFIVAYGIL
mgnify:CR=1